MTEHPILFTSPMVRAILDGHKTQTRRVIKPQPVIGHNGRVCYWRKGYDVPELGEPIGEFQSRARYLAPYGSIGDLLWVRETWWDFGNHYLPSYSSDRENAYWVGLKDGDPIKPQYAADGEPRFYDCIGQWIVETNEEHRLAGRMHWRKWPSIFMPKWACRLWLKVKNVRVERVQEISDADVQAEGIMERGTWREEIYDDEGRPNGGWLNWQETFEVVWDSINAKRKGCAWDDNPWVWVIEFERTERDKP